MEQQLVKLRVRVPRGLLDLVDLLVEGGLYPSRNEAIRAGIRMTLEELKHGKRSD